MSALGDSKFGTIPPAITDAVKADIAQQLWAWIHAHSDMKVVTINWWIVRKTFYVRDLEVVFELLLGPDPSKLAPNVPLPPSAT